MFLPFRGERRAEHPASPREGACMRPCQPVPRSGGVRCCTGAMQGCCSEGRGSGWCMRGGEVFHPLRHPPVKVKGSLMFSEMLFKAAPLVLLAQLGKQRALGSPHPLSP